MNSYSQLSNIPSHAGGNNARRENFTVRHMSTCAFPRPAPHRIYCQPAAFQRTCGTDQYHNMGVAYGMSAPSFPQ